jgi:Arc-like DNA binding domain
MPEELREKLNKAAGRTGRSLNAEIVARLEESLRPSPVAHAAHRVRLALSYVRGGGMRKRWLGLGLGAAVLVVTAAIPFITHSASGPVLQIKGDPDAGSLKPSVQTAVGPNELRIAGDTAEAQEAYWRAYPANVDDISFAATLRAQAAFAEVKARGNATGDWELSGPTKATYPGVLNVLNDGDQYVASGRTIAMAISPSCTNSRCRLYIGAAGGGVWRTDKALQNANWEFISGSFETSAIGTLEIDPNDPNGNTIYAGTGEPNASGDSAAGMGIYKSTDGGSTWTLLPGSVTAPSNFRGRAVSDIAIAPNGDIIVGVARAIRGYSGNTGGATSNPPPTTLPANFGVYRSTNGGASFSLIWDAQTAGSVRGVTHVELDPHTPSTIYASAFNLGVWRSIGGAAFTQIKTPLVAALNTDRAEFAVNALPGGKTRMYVGIGNQQGPAPAVPARLWKSDDAAGAAVFADITTPQVLDYCTAQCWYDSYVISPKGHPDIVYVGGSFSYDQLVCCGDGSSNGRGVLLSTNGGSTWSDLTQDADRNQAEGLHPDHHELVVNPNNPLEFFSASDGGIVRGEGGFSDITYKCDQRGLNAARNAYCKSLLWRVPNSLVHINDGLSTLQFNSISVSSQRPKNLAQAGTQDNGTFEYTGSKEVWKQEIYGDGGQSGFSVTDDALRFNTFFGQASDVNFRNGDPTKWVIATGPIVSSPEGSNFYPPIIADPNPGAAKTIFQGSQSVWRTQNWGGDQAFLEANCPEFTTNAATPTCGDFVRIGPAGATDLTSAAYGGADRAGGFVSRIARAQSNTGTIWVSTNPGRLFVSTNADAAAGSVMWTRIDTTASNDPGRFISGLYVDPTNPNRAWVSYTGYNFTTPAQPGHVFRVDWNGTTATWTNLDGGTGPMGDLPVTDVVRDGATDTLYAATDFGVLKSVGGGAWTLAGTGMPMVEVAGLTIVPSERILYAATHGRSIWRITLP